MKQKDLLGIRWYYDDFLTATGLNLYSVSKEIYDRNTEEVKSIVSTLPGVGKGNIPRHKCKTGCDLAWVGVYESGQSLPLIEGQEVSLQFKIGDLLQENNVGVKRIEVFRIMLPDSADVLRCSQNFGGDLKLDMSDSYYSELNKILRDVDSGKTDYIDALEELDTAFSCDLKIKEGIGGSFVLPTLHSIY